MLNSIASLQLGNDPVPGIDGPQASCGPDALEWLMQTALSRLAEFEKMAAINELALGIVHDFNNMLAAIRGFAALIVSASLCGCDQHEYALRIMTTCDRAAEVVAQINSYVDIKNAPQDLVGIGSILDEARVLFTGLLPPHATLLVADDSANTAVTGNASQLIAPFRQFAALEEGSIN